MRRGIIIAVVVLSSGLLVNAAWACRALIFEKGLFFTPPLTGIEAEIIAEVTITEIVTSEGLGLPAGVSERYYQVALARVQKVIKGEVGEAVIKVANLPTSCGPNLDKLSIGFTGVVAGKIGKDRDGMPVLFARGESSYRRDRRLKGSVSQTER